MEEVWAQIPGFDRYEISNHGRARQHASTVFPSNIADKKNRILKTGQRNTKYVSINLTVNGKRKSYWMHRMVWIAFKGPIPKGMHINHMDFNTTNNRIDNLECCSMLENMRHLARSGKMRRASAHLSDLDVTVIRKSVRSRPMLSRLFKISVCTAKSIQTRQTLKYIVDVAV